MKLLLPLFFIFMLTSCATFSKKVSFTNQQKLDKQTVAKINGFYELQSLKSMRKFENLKPYLVEKQDPDRSDLQLMSRMDSADLQSVPAKLSKQKKVKKAISKTDMTFFIPLRQKMSTKYKATTTDQAYFITITTVGWIDIFTRLNQKYIITKALQYCQNKKGLEIYAYCLMSSHLHLLCKGIDGFILSDIMRDFKKFTSKEIVKTIEEEPESRREWLLAYFEKSCEHLKRKQAYKVWQDGYHAEIVESNWFIKQKVNYIHNNPVKEKIVTLPEDYYFSSARNYAALDYELEVILLDLF